MVFKGSLAQVQRGGQAEARAGLYLQMPVSLGDVDGACAHRFSLDALAHLQRAAAVQALGKHLGEQLRHVLHDKNREGEVGRQIGQQNIQRRRASGGYADDQHGRN